VGYARYTKEGAQASGRPEGSVMVIAFHLDGQEFTALNGGPAFKFNEALSLVVNCESQRGRFWAAQRTASVVNDAVCLRPLHEEPS
jgi:predicted 3-demethylubiquinone-9 3-methyltransferase (glyoxalase superfamily)